jgi:hypothetical protein
LASARSISASVTWELAAKRARTTLRQLMPTEMKSRTVSGATPAWPSALMNCCALMLAWLAKAVTPSSISSAVASDAEAARGLPLKPFVDSVSRACATTSPGAFRSDRKRRRCWIS